MESLSQATNADRAGDDVAALRAFNRSYTEVIGVLQEGLLRTPYSLTQARVIFELGRLDAIDVADLRRLIGIDGGYLSRILAGFEEDGLVTRVRSPDDRRRHIVALSAAGRREYDVLDTRSADDARELLGRLDGDDRDRLLGAMATIRGVLFETARPRAVALREPRPGDLGWVIQRHGAAYAAEYGWDSSFEALVARIVADHAAGADPACERGWIAEVDGRRAGSVFCMRRDADTAQLRLLLVDRAARGLGVGTRLVDECVAFARTAGYARIMLWTQDCLVAARRVYETAGFRLLEQAPHRSFGADLVEQYWSLDLRTRA
jgi:DNA-binding MarR family transcriptional regulator/GNAT superfamily N-acetyltransferase